MQANDYQNATDETAIYPKESGVLYCVLGLTNEAGEVAGKYKKFIRDLSNWEDVRQALKAELGDVQWYVARLAAELDFDLEEIMEDNLAKLRGRKARGTLGGSGDNR
jgi:NTP pyrophosphatase (non-canonical NTP hydrolase)